MPSKSNANGAEDKYAATTWAVRDFDFTTPSGQLCLLRKMDTFDLLDMGLMDKLDFATGVVMEKHVKNAQMSNVERIKRDRARREAKAAGEDPDLAEQGALMEEAWDKVQKDPKQLLEFRGILNEVVERFVVAPKMLAAPEKEEDRVEGFHYTDMIPFEDKVAVFNVLMKGTRVVEQFRDGSEEAVGGVASKPSVRPAPKRRAPARRK